MEAKEKAIELVNKFRNHVQVWDCYWDAPLPDEDIMRECKNCALIAVDEILKACPIQLVGNTGKFIYTDDYWQQVKEEISKLCP